MTKRTLDDMTKRIDLQNAEFDALTRLATSWSRLQLVPVVDDDYPEFRHAYECDLRAFLQACADNGRTLPEKQP